MRLVQMPQGQSFPGVPAQDVCKFNMLRGTDEIPAALCRHPVAEHDQVPQMDGTHHRELLSAHARKLAEKAVAFVGVTWQYKQVCLCVKFNFVKVAAQGRPAYSPMIMM